ncbi:cytochrome c biogenesis CcdA family protein [soil metagenome]
MTETVLTGPLVLALLIAALAGTVSFASPCVLPLVPGFIGYVSGMSATTVGQQDDHPATKGAVGVITKGPGTRTQRRAGPITGTALFVAGFSTVFISMSVVLSSASLLLAEHQSLLLRLGGLVVVVMGVLMVRPQFAGARLAWRPAVGLWGAPLLGVAFGLGFSACSGPTLAAIQTLGASLAPQDDVVFRAVLLAVAYCAGLGLPFIAVAAGADWVTRWSRWLRTHHDTVQRASGVLLVVVGILMITGAWDTITTWIQIRLTSSFTTVL